MTDEEEKEKEINEAIEGMIELYKVGDSEEVSEANIEEMILSNQDLLSQAKNKA